MRERGSDMSGAAQDKRIYIMAEEKPVKAVFKMGVPVAMGMLFMVVYNLVDTYFIGLLHDDYQLAAANLSYPVMMVSVAIASIVGNGGASYMARCIGADRRDRAAQTLTIGIELLLVSGLLLTVFGALLIDPIVALLGAKDNTFQYTKDYCIVMILGSVFTMSNYAVGQLLRSEGSTVYSMIGMISGTVANMVLDPIFIFALKMEIKGAAIATVLGNVLSTVIFLWFYARRKTLLVPSLRLARLDMGIIKEILLVGVPNTLEQFFATAAMIVNNNLAAGYGEQTVAAMGIANKIMSFGTYIYQGMAGGCQPLMGYNYGAQNHSRMKALLKAGVASIAGVELAIMAVFGVFAPCLIDIFTDSPEVISIGTATLRALMIMLPFVGTTTVIRSTFNAMGKSMFAFGITIVRQLVLYIPCLLLFNQIWGFQGLIHAQPTEEIVCMMFALWLISGQMKKLRS